MNKQELIERYEKFKASKKKLTSVDLVLKDLRSLDEPEPLPFKLKDVVRRIRGFDPTTQTRWLNDILKELGDDYGSMKYRKGYEQGKFEGEWVGNQLKDADKIRQESNKVALPNFMDDWIFKCQLLNNFSLSDALNSKTINLYAKNGEVVMKWLKDKKNQELFARAWLDGYEVEEEKRYLVKIKGNIKENMLVYGEFVERYFFTKSSSLYNVIHFHTRKELEEAGFGWVFDCPGIEMEEVEGWH